MSKFKQPSSYPPLTPQPTSPENGSDQEPKPTDLPLPSSTPATASALSVTFRIEVFGGEFDLPLMMKDSDAISAQLQAWVVAGVVVPNQRGMEWYPMTSIKKISVLFL